jgi:predicted kinase
MIWSLIKDKSWDSLEKRFDWVADMKGVVQDPRHHAEGDVAVHTRMVLESLYSLEEFRNLDIQSQELLWASALLHDVEKRSTTSIEHDGSITSRGHAKKGEYTARDILFREVPTPFFLREKVCALARHHGLPLWIFDKAHPVKALYETALRIEMPLLAMLAKADVLGRICNDRQELLDRVELFREFCQEQQCWTSSHAFASDLARFVYFQKEDSSPDYNPYDDLKGEVTMLCGLPGMGKDRYINKFCTGVAILSLDDIRRKHKLKPDDPSATGWAVQEAKEQAKVYLRKGEPFVWNATNVTKQMRSQWIDLFVSYKARVNLVYIEVPFKDWMKQNSNREHPVPANVLEKLLGKLEVPTLDEAHHVQYVVSE